MIQRLIITDHLDLNGLRDDTILTVQTITLEEADRLVTAALYGSEDHRREVVQAVEDELTCDLLNEAGRFGMVCFTRRWRREFVLTTDDTALLVKRHTGQTAEVLTFKIVGVEAAIVSLSDPFFYRENIRH